MRNLRLHHIGIATSGIDAELPIYRALGYAPETAPFAEEDQRVRCQFVTSAGAPRLELLENKEAGGPLASWLVRGAKLCHLAYESEDVEADSTRLQRECGAKIISPPRPSVFFDKICFAMLPNMVLIELVVLKQR